jgi:hypothetical protein
LIASLRHTQAHIHSLSFTITTTATPCLPIGKGTLKYGSDDGGKTIIKKDKLLNEIMKMAALEIGLKKHTVGLKQPCKIYGPADIEGHLGYVRSFHLNLTYPHRDSIH